MRVVMYVVGQRLIALNPFLQQMELPGHIIAGRDRRRGVMFTFNDIQLESP